MNRKFYEVVVNCLTATMTNTIIWFALTFWAYLETQSVLVTSFMAGIYLATVAISGLFLGAIVDHNLKKRVMLLSSIASLVLYSLAAWIYWITPAESFKQVSSIALWLLIILALFGAIAGNLRSIALSTVVVVMVEEKDRDKANGLVGTVNGVAFMIASLPSAILIGQLGMFWTLMIGVGLTLLVVIHMMTIEIREELVTHDTEKKRVDIRGTVRAVNEIPGLFGLIFFNMFNNFLGGIFMALMDAYGLSLVSVEMWGLLFSFLSLGFIAGGLIVSKFGLGKNVLRTLFICNIVMWTSCIFFTIQPSIVMLAGGMLVFMSLAPVVEAAEQTILQRVIPKERLGRVIGFAQSLEQAASPVTAFVIGPIAQFIFIPFMTTGKGVELIGSWFGTGQARGLALLFTLAGMLGLIVTLIAMRTRAYTALKEHASIPTEEEKKAAEAAAAPH